MTDGRELTFDQIRGPRMFPVLGGKIIERQQCVAIFFEAADNAGNMDEPLGARFSRELRDPFGGCYMDGMEGILAALHIETHGVHDALDIRYGDGDRAIVFDVGMNRLNTEPNARDAAMRPAPKNHEDAGRPAGRESQSCRIRSQFLLPSFNSPADALMPAPPQAHPGARQLFVGGRFRTGTSRPNHSPIKRNTSCSKHGMLVGGGLNGL
jgi:hypothetical protein